MNIYHGTTKKLAELIIKSKILKAGNYGDGPGVCLNIQQAMQYADSKCNLQGIDSRRSGRVIVFEGLPAQLLNTASKSTDVDSFTLNDEFKEPSKGLHFVHAKVLTMTEAEELAKITKVKVYDENEEN